MSNMLNTRVQVGVVATALASLAMTGLHVESASAAAPAGVPMVRAMAPTIAVPASAARKAKKKAKKGGWVLVSNRSQKAAPKGTVLRASVVVRSKKKSAITRILFRQVVAGHVTNSRTAAVKVKRSWRTVNVAIHSSTKASKTQVYVARTAIRINRVSVGRVGAAVSTTPLSPTPANPADWKLDLNEDFDSLPSNIWNIKNNASASNEDSYLLAANTSVGGGVLRIQGKLQSAGGRSYTSGYVDTNGKYSVPNYFRAEVRAKVPFEQGMWAAPLWFRPAGGGNGEIDMVETLGNEKAKPTFHQTIHTEYGATHKQAAFTKLFSSVGSASATAWHTYTMEKTPGRITMWVDGVKTSEFTPANPSWYDKYYEIGQRWNLRVNLQIGGTWGGKPNSTTNWSGDNTAMQVDYIKTWVPN
jgi:hypothetical protein